MNDNNMHHFCTYFDSNYLPRGLCLLESLERHCSEFTLTVLCLDNLCLERIQGLNRVNVIPVSLEELEDADPELLAVKSGRSKLEYYFTCGPSFIRYALDREPDIEVVTYLDADLYFYSDPQPLFDAFNRHSIGVIGHHLPMFRKNTRQGLFNVGWINFRRDSDGIACLELWRRQCIEWCYDRHEDGKYADQLYLDQWPTLFEGFYEFTHHGANVAAWNVGDYSFSLRVGKVFVDNDPLVFYHFHGFKKIAQNIYNTGLWLHFKAPHPVLKSKVFTEYIEKLELYSSDQNPTSSIRNYRPKFHYLKLVYRCVIGILFRQYIVVIRNRIF